MRLTVEKFSLVHSKAVLFIYYDETQVLEYYRIFYQGVCPHEKVYFSIFKFLQNLLLLFRCCVTGQQGCPVW